MTLLSRRAFLGSSASVLAAGCGQGIGGGTGASSIPGSSLFSGAGPQPSGKPRAAKIALLLPLSGFGETAQVARGMKQAVEMALFEADNPAIQLITKDDGGTPQGAMAAADAAIADGGEVILGPLFGPSAEAIRPIAVKANVPVLTFSNDAAVAGGGVYVMGGLASDEVARVVSYARRYSRNRFAALIPDSAYGKAVSPAFHTAVVTSGGMVARVGTYQPAGTGLLNAAKVMAADIAAAREAGNPIDALFIAAGRETVTQLGPLLSQSGIDTGAIKLLGTSTWDGVAPDPALKGAWYAAADPAEWQTFVANSRRRSGASRLGSPVLLTTACALL